MSRVRGATAESFRPSDPIFNPGDRNNRLAILEGIARASWHFGLVVVTVCPEATYRDSNHAERRAAGYRLTGTGGVTTTPTAWGSAVPPGRRTQFRSSCPGGTIDVQGGTDFTIAP